MTSLDGPGFSITLLKATPDILGHIDADTDAVGWPRANSSVISGVGAIADLPDSGVDNHGAHQGAGSGVLCMCWPFRR